MRIRLVYPTIINPGLGNNLITLAKAYLISQSCDMTYQSPVWPPYDVVPAPDGYGYYFPVTRTQKLMLKLIPYQYRILRRFRVQLWPTLFFTREDYHRTGVIDVGDACLVYLEERGLADPAKSVIVTTMGMWPGYGGIKRARPWLRGLLLSHAATRQHLAAIEERTQGRLRVCVHIRMNDYKLRKEVGPIKEGERNIRLPLEWYARICRLIRAVCDCTFILVTDGTREALSPFLEEFNPVNGIEEPYRDLLDVLLISRSDLVICSNSTYSRLGVFLNDKPYIWCADPLVRDPSGRFGYLHQNHIADNPVPTSDRSDPNAIRRCFALSTSVSDLPGGLKRYLTSNGTLPIEIPNDLVYHDPVYLM